MKKVKTNYPLEINDYNYDLLKVFCHSNQRVCYECTVCGAHTEKYLFTIEKPMFLCRKHQIEATAKERYGSVEAMQEMNLQHGNETKKRLYGDEHFVNLEKMKATKKERYGDSTYTNREKAKKTLQDKYGVDTPLQLNSAKEKYRQTCVELYGVDNPMKSLDVKVKQHNTVKKTYGVDNISQLESTKEKVKVTNNKNFGVDYPMQSDDIKEKVKAHNIEVYGVDHPMKLESTKGALAKVFFEKYGVTHPMKSAEIIQRVKETNLEKYGFDNPAKSELVKSRIRETNEERYGVSYVLESPEIQEKIRQTCLKKYGIEHPQFKHLYLYDNEVFDSSWELYFYIHQLDLGKNISRANIEIPYIFEGKEHKYNPDFIIDDKLYEIKGDQFFSEDGTMCNPYDPSKTGLFEAKHQCGLSNGVIFLRESDLKDSIKYVDDKYTSDYVTLFKIGLDFPYPKYSIEQSTDLGLIGIFHKSLYEASYKGRPSPVQGWNDKSLIKKSALNRLKYVGRCKPEDVLRGFSVAKIAPKVSLFKPTLAQRLVETYLSEFSTVFDPFSGFSGRMLGTYNAGKKYIGSDINTDHVTESNLIIEYKGIQDKASVSVQDILTVEPAEYECLFTCPPYGGKEHWNENNDEVEHTCDEWIDICLEKFKCKKFLFVVDETKKYKDNIVETLTNKSHFGKNNEYVVLIQK